MKTLIKFITSNAAGGSEIVDKYVDLPITIGRATDQVLHLKDRRARLQHAVIDGEFGDIRISTTALAGVTVNGSSTRDAKLSVGDKIEVGANILTVIAPRSDTRFAITFELDKDLVDSTTTESWSDRPQDLSGWGKRRLSWVLTGIVFVFALALPALSLLGGASSIMRSIPLPDDSWWLAGPVHSAHSSVSADCETCHVDAFQRVPDAACAECHTVNRHVADTGKAVIGDRRCAACHLEHNEPPQLVKQHQGLCADCHSDLPDTTSLQPAQDFLGNHPAFKLSLLLPVDIGDGQVDWQNEHMVLKDSLDADRSNLLFSHKAHLAEHGIITPDGKRVIECVECHEPEPGGARMQPVTMDQHCSSCHTLAFDPDDPSRVVPHGDPAAVVQTLVEYYSARLLGDDPDAVEQRVRRPGQSLTREDRNRAATEARKQALEVAADLFERRACATCHEVTRTATGEDLPWQVLPVRLTDSFYPHANFSHAAHDTEVTSCESCHRAGESESSHDVLIPDIDDCRACHGGAIARRNDNSQIPSTCIMCHSFHFEAKGEYR
jgi:hypothetical protein